MQLTSYLVPKKQIKIIIQYSLREKRKITKLEKHFPLIKTLHNLQMQFFVFHDFIFCLKINEAFFLLYRSKRCS